MLKNAPPRVLIVAGSDSSGGAGIQADIKTATVLGAYAMTAITAVTVQDTTGVHSFHPVPPKAVAAQIEAVLSDIGADAIKTGMLVSAETVEAVAAALEAFCSLAPPPPRAELRSAPPPQAGEENIWRSPPVSSPVYGGGARAASGGGGIPLVVDTVMVAKGGTALLDDAGAEAMRKLLFPMATLITPNAPEAARLTGLSVESPDDLVRAGKMLLETGVHAVLVKGGHIAGDTVTDVLVDAEGVRLFRSRRIANPNTHGTGCTLATAIATGLAQGLPLEHAVERARAFVHEAIRNGLALGRGTGPVNHLHAIPPYGK